MTGSLAGYGRPPTVGAHQGSSAYGHLNALLVRFAAMDPQDRGRRSARDVLVAGYLPVIHHIARRFAGRGEPAEDLEQVGTIGLIKALDRFDPGRDVDFLSYLVPTVTGEIRRYFRDRTWAMRVPRKIKDLKVAIAQASGPLSQALQRAPRPTEIAAWLSVPLETVLEALVAEHACSSVSLDAVDEKDDVTLADAIGHADAALDAVEFREALVPLLDALPHRERTILLLRFFADMTQSQIAEQMRISQMHVSRLLDRTLAELRRQLLDDGRAPRAPDPAAVDRQLGRLRAYDEQNRTDLTTTLAASLANDGSLYQVAARLGIHRSTLRYRLRRIRDISGLDERDPATREQILRLTHTAAARAS